jgi:hypothetical protein
LAIHRSGLVRLDTHRESLSGTPQEIPAPPRQPSADIEARPNKRCKLPGRQRAIADHERSPHLALMVADALAPDPLEMTTKGHVSCTGSVSHGQRD